MKLLRKILGGISLTAAMFVFQACYGTEPDCEKYVEYTFRVVDDQDHTPIPDVMIQKQLQSTSDYEYDWEGYYQITDSNGVAVAEFCSDYGQRYKFRFTTAHSDYEVLDTIIEEPVADTIEIALHRIN